MKICPNCGFREPVFCWRLPYSRGTECEYTTINVLEEYFPLIAKHLKEASVNNRGLHEWQDQFYAYGYWERSGYVRRRDIEIWKYQHWKAIPMEKVKQ